VGDSFPITAGIVGCGANARSHGDAIEGNEGRIQLVACCDIHPKRAAAFAGRYDVSTTYTDHVTMVEEENLDLVILSTWPKQHEDQVYIILRKQNEVETYATEAANAFEEQLLHLCTCLSAGTTPRFTVDESVRNLAVIDAMLESAATNTYTAPDVPHGF
jgi:predicted dehydrogenase